jgi:ParB family transcriptional regulator, chromosome partitioning protein
MKTDQFQSLEIPLNKLLAWNGNVRTTGADEGIDELAASIASVGLLQSLVVKKEQRGKYAVVAGKRRLLALSRLACDGTVEPSLEIPCRIAPPDADLPEISLSENVLRQPMHPADEFEAFQRLLTGGRSVADIAARFGVSEAVVNRRLALARVSQVLLAKYREGELNLELLQAFTLTDDHEAQEAVWSQLQPWDRRAQTIRRMLSSNDIPATDKRVRFVGLPAYEAEGGAVRRDLFADEEQGTYVADAAILTRLVNDKLKGIADTVKAEGWKWVEVQPDLDHQWVSRHKRVYAPKAQLSSELAAEVAALEKERDGLEQSLEDSGEDTEAQEAWDQIESLTDRINTIEKNRTCVYGEDVKARCGVVVSVGHDGEVELIRGLVRKEDQVVIEGTETASQVTVQESGYSAALVEALTQHKTAAIAIELTRQPKTALAALVHTLVLRQFGLDLGLYRAKSCLQVSTTQADLNEAAASPALVLLEEQRADWPRKLPTTTDDLWQWCLDQDQETLLQLLAYCAARSLNAVKSKADGDRDRLQHSNALATALRLDMTAWFTPTTENFFGRVSKSQIAECLKDAGKPLSAESMSLKKADLAALAEREMQGTGWLPEPIRLSTDSHGVSNANDGEFPGI